MSTFLLRGTTTTPARPREQFTTSVRHLQWRPPTFPAMPISDLEEAIRTRPEGFLLVDVREPDEFRAGNIPGAINIPLGTVSQAFALDAGEFEETYGSVKTDPGTPGLVVYCRSGVRSETARKILKQQFGYNHTLNYEGSWLEWAAKNNLPYV